VLRGERAALGIARFKGGRAALVLGGTVTDWPLIQAAQLSTSQVRLDPAEGLFGLAVVGARPFLKHDELRAALAMAINREALVGALGVPRWLPIDRLLPAQLDSDELPAKAGWTDLSFADRQAEARKRVAAWTQSRGPLPPLRIALPQGSGMTIVFARLAADWAAIGISAVQVANTAPDADLRLIDEVAPSGSANWYLTRTSCDAGVACSTDAETALKESRAAPTLTARSTAIAKADAAAATANGYIPLARPVRWSLVAPSLTGFHENSFAVHPLSELMPGRN